MCSVLNKLNKRIRQIKPAANVKTEIQVLLSEQKNLSQLVAKQSPKQNQDTLRLMQALELTEQGKPHAQIIEKF